MGCSGSNVATSAHGAGMKHGGMNMMDMKNGMMSMENMTPEQMKMMKEKMCPKEKEDAGWSMRYPPNKMVKKYTTCYFPVLGRGIYVYVAIAAGKAMRKNCKMSMMKNMPLEHEMTFKTFQQWPEFKQQLKSVNGHGFMPVIKEFVECPKTGKKMESPWLDETIDLIRRICMNEGIRPPMDADKKHCEQTNKVGTMIWKDTFEGLGSVLGNGEHAKTGFSSPEAIDAICAELSHADHLPKSLKNIKSHIGNNLMSNGSTNSEGKFWFGDCVLFAFLARHIYNPKLKDKLWDPVVVQGGHEEWVEKFWNKWNPMLCNDGDLRETLMKIPVNTM